MSITAAAVYPRALRSLAEMVEVVEQYQQGLVTSAEMILALQLTPHQVDAVIAHSQLPYAIQSRSSLADWDEEITMKQERGDAPLRYVIQQA